MGDHELMYFAMIMMGACTLCQCMTMWISAQHIAEAILKNDASQPVAEPIAEPVTERKFAPAEFSWSWGSAPRSYTVTLAREDYAYARV